MNLSRLASRLAAVAFGALLLSTVWAQNLGSTWGDYSGKDGSSFGNGAFIAGDRTLFIRWEGVNTLTCKDVAGATLWEYPLGTSIGIDSILVTTDGYIYLSGYDAPSQQDGKGIILALRFDGTLAWRYDFNKRPDINESLGQMRIFGGSIVVCGSGKPTTSGPEPQSIVIASVDRFTGAENYVQGFTPGGISMGYRGLRSGGGFAYLLATGPIQPTEAPCLSWILRQAT